MDTKLHWGIGIPIIAAGMMIGGGTGGNNAEFLLYAGGLLGVMYVLILALYALISLFFPPPSDE